MSKELIKKIQRKVGVLDDGDAGPITWNAIANALSIVSDNIKSDNKLISIALTEYAAGVYETSKNQGPGIEKYWTSTTYKEGYNNREPWCAAFVSWVCMQSGIFTEAERPKTAGAFAYETWGDSSKKVTVKRKPTSVTKGDIVIFSFSHIAIATSDSDKNFDFTTIEGNTNPAGSREGNGIYKKIRNIALVRSVITIK